jgi:hypothetical protein
VQAEELVAGFRPENELEAEVAASPEFRDGMSWGKPRSGHPEGSVGAHVADLLETIDDWGETGDRREQLRFISLVHDTLKNRVSNLRPKTGENHHAMRARRLAERFTGDERLLSTIEQHDRPYAIWRKMKRKGSLDEKAFVAMMERVKDPGLFLRFIELDGSTEGKNPEPIEWFRDELERRGYETA